MLLKNLIEPSKKNCMDYLHIKNLRITLIIWKAYKNSYHMSVKMSPSDVNKSNSHQVLDNLYGYVY